MKKVKTTLVLLLAAMLVAANTGFAAAEEEKVWREAAVTDSSSANPHTATLSVDSDLSSYVTGNLYREKPAEDRVSVILVPELAESEPQQMDDEGTVWNIKIREGAVWENGDPINADTFIYSWKMAMDPVMLNAVGTSVGKYYIEIVNANAYYMQNQEGYEAVAWEDVGIKKIDDYTIQITTTEPYAAEDVMRQFNMTSTKPVNEELYEAGMNESRTATNYGTELEYFLSSGPFVFSEWVKGSQRVYIKNPLSPLADSINFDKVIIRVVPDSSTQLQLFENGELDCVLLDFYTYPIYMEDPRLWSVNTVLIYHFEINRVNEEQPILQDKEFRKALFYAIDRNTLASLLYSIPAPYYIHHLAYVDAENGILYRDLPEAQALVPENGGYDPALAKQYFDSAMERYGLESIQVKFLVEDTGAVLRAMSEYLQQSMPAIFGEDRFSIEIEILPDTQKTSLMRSWATQPNGYEIGGHLFNIPSTTLYPTRIFAPYTSSSNTYTNYGNETFDELYALSQTAEYRLDVEKKKEILLALEKEFLDDVMNLPTVEYVAHALVSERVLLPVDEYIPSQGLGVMFADIAE